MCGRMMFVCVCMLSDQVLFAFSADVFPASQRTLISGALNAAGNIGAALGGLMSPGCKPSLKCSSDLRASNERHGCGSNERGRVTQVLVSGSMNQLAMLVHVFDPQPHVACC